MSGDSLRKFIIDDDQSIVLPNKDHPHLYRVQKYALAGQPDRSPLNFTRKPRVNRFSPSQSEVQTAYFGASILTAILEGSSIFRFMDLTSLPTSKIKFGRELEHQELLTCSLSCNIRLFDLTVEGTYGKNRVTSSITTSTNLTEANDFAEAVINHGGYDGIFYRTRHGGNYSIVIFDAARDKLGNMNVISRENLYAFLEERSDIQKQLGIIVTDDM